MRLEFDELVRNRDVEIEVVAEYENGNDVSFESLEELSPGCYTPVSRFNITVEPDGTISPHCKGFSASNCKLVINGMEGYTSGTFSILDSFQSLSLDDTTELLSSDSDVEFVGAFPPAVQSESRAGPSTARSVQSQAASDALARSTT